MSIQNNHSSYLLVLFSIFILFFITIWQYEFLQENLDEKNESLIKLQEKEDILRELNDLKLKVKSEEVREDLEKYRVNFSEDEIIKYIYDYAFNSQLKEDRVIIKNISLTPWVKNELWFLESNISLSVRVENENAMRNLLDFLLKDESKYVFFMDSFTYPYDSREWSFDLSLPLKMFYIQ